MAKPSPLGSKVAGFLLPFVAVGLMGYTWYIYTFRICAHLITKEPETHRSEAIAFIVIATLLWTMALLCYARILLTPPGKPDKSNIISSESGGLSNRNLPRYFYSPELYDLTKMESHCLDQQNVKTALLSVCKQDGQAKYCHFCDGFKPERAHHCRECNACVLKMDHHCPWVSGCVGFRNYKFFVLFLLYTGLYGAWVFITSLPLVVRSIQEMSDMLDPQWIVLIIIAFIFGFTVLGFAGVHFSYILRNETTIEHLSNKPYDIRVDFDNSGHNFEVISVAPENYLWEQSKKHNWRSVMGNSFWGWFVPIKQGLGTGLVFPYSEKMYQNIVDRARKQRGSLDVSHFESTTHIERLSSVESTTRMTST
ncbi:DHHC palmitoyltransferase-domain-containing protein [Sporodiniella umbellata]|nr:DHHC palmitoyltransferase-domain-containing protein [Sporodiniella umbellata]